jgi:hypothetical protein
VPRANPFTRSDTEKRRIEARVDPSLVKVLTDEAPIVVKKGYPTLEVAKERFAFELVSTIWAYRARVIGNKQERPARIVATLKQGAGRTKKLLEWLKSLPQSVRFELRAEGIEDLLNDQAVLLDALYSNARSRSAYWQDRVETHRPTGAGDASLTLRQSLMDLINRFSPEDPSVSARQKRKN